MKKTRLQPNYKGQILDPKGWSDKITYKLIIDSSNS